MDLKEDVKEIVDSHGNSFKKKEKGYDIKRILYQNIWEIVGSGIVMLFGIINSVVTVGYECESENFYGINRRYFVENSSFKEQLVFLLLLIIISLYPIFLEYANKKLKSRLFAIWSFLMIFYILLSENVLFNSQIINKYNVEFVENILSSNFTYAIFAISDIIIAFYITKTNRRGLKKYVKIICGSALCIYLIDLIIGFYVIIFMNVSDKKKYEMIDNNQVIVSEYEGKYVIMDCLIESNVLKIKKGNYYLSEMTNHKITYLKFEDVECQ